MKHPVKKPVNFARAKFCRKITKSRTCEKSVNFKTCEKTCEKNM